MKKCLRIVLSAYHAGLLTKEENAVFPILHIWRMQKRKHRMEGDRGCYSGQRADVSPPRMRFGTNEQRKRNANLTTRALNKDIRI